MGPALPSTKNQALAQQLQPPCEPGWCRSQLQFGMKPWGFQIHSLRCLGICNFQQELGAISPPQDPALVTHLFLLGSKQSHVRQLLEESSLFYCRQKAGLVSVTRSRCVSLPKPFPNPTSQGLCRRAARQDGSAPPGATQTSPSQRWNLQSCPSPSKPGRKNQDFSQCGYISPGMAPSSRFL